MTTPALTQQPCKCGARAATECPGEWAPGCDLGANEAHVRVAPDSLAQQLIRAVAASDAGHDPFCASILRGKGCDCGLGQRGDPGDADCMVTRGCDHRDKLG